MLDEEIALVDQEILLVEKATEDEEQNIKSIKEEEKGIQSEITAAEQQLIGVGGDEKARGALQRKVDRLRRKEGDFRTQRNALYKKEEQLRTKEEQLRTKKEQLRAIFILEMQSNQKSKAMSADSQGELAKDGLIRLKFEQLGASAFTASQGKSCSSCLYNGTKPITFNSPEIIRDLSKVEATPDLIASAKLAVLEGLPKTIFPVKVSETRAENGMEPTVQQEAGTSLLNFLEAKPEIMTRSQMKLEDVQSSYGPATKLSTPNGLCYVEILGRNIPLGLFEFKDSAYSPLEQTGKAFASGANLALSQERWGLAASKVAVPLIMANGQLYQFAMTTLLDKIPVLHMLTHVLDANKPSDMEEIAKLLVIVRQHMISQAGKLRAGSRPPVLKSAESGGSLEFSFEKKKYFFKSKARVFNRFGAIEIERKVLPLLWEIFEALSSVEGVVKPLGYGRFKGLSDFSGSDMGSGGLVFENLLLYGFKMGVPGDFNAHEKFCSSLEDLVHEVHAHGVIHVDLFPSNILWSNRSDGHVEVRIIDWDAATFAGEHFTDCQYERLKKFPHHYYIPDSIAKPENDAWHVFILYMLNDTQRARLHGAGAKHPENVIDGYIKCIDEMVQDSEGLENLQRCFLTWFEGFETRGREPRDTKRQRREATQPAEAYVGCSGS